MSAFYVLKVEGCDDSTVVQLDLSDDEAKTLRGVCDVVNSTSSYGCQPRMRLAPGEIVDAEIVEAEEF